MIQNYSMTGMKLTIINEYVMELFFCSKSTFLISSCLFSLIKELRSVHIRSKVWTHSEKPENQSKNRYGNVVACTCFCVNACFLFQY